jgi:hypothetical protein
MSNPDSRGAAAEQQIENIYTALSLEELRAWDPSPGVAAGDGVLTADLAAEATVSLRGSKTIFGDPVDFELTVKADRPGMEVRVTFGSHFQSFSRSLGVMEQTVQTFAFAAPPEGFRHGGGESDGTVRLPIRLSSIAFSRGKGPAEAVRVEDVQLRCRTRIEPDEAVKLVAATAESPYEGVWTAVCTAWNLLPEAVEGQLHKVLRDWEGNVRGEEVMDWTLPPNGESVSETAAFDIDPADNFLAADFTFVANGREDVCASACYARPLEESGSNELQPSSPWGMGIYLNRYPDSEPGRALMDKAAALARDAGVKWTREEFMWSRICPERGAYRFDFYDRVVETALAHGISVYGLVDYWSRWTKPYTEEGIEDYCEYARDLVLHYKDRIKHWEVWNEPNIFFWQGPKEMYPVLLERAYAAIKEADPDAKVLGISTCTFDPTFIQMCTSYGAPYDILTVHPYRNELDDLGLMDDFWMTADLVDHRPIWVTEMGWSSNVGRQDPAMGPAGVSEREQAERLARCYLSSMASECCQNISWYNFRCDGTDPFYNETNFGVLRRDLTPKPAYRAAATVCNTLSEGKAARREDFEPVFGLTMGDATALWCGAEPREVRVRVSDGVRVLNLMGEELHPERIGDVLRLQLQPNRPVFIKGGEAVPA